MILECVKFSAHFDRNDLFLTNNNLNRYFPFAAADLANTGDTQTAVMMGRCSLAKVVEILTVVVLLRAGVAPAVVDTTPFLSLAPSRRRLCCAG